MPKLGSKRDGAAKKRALAVAQVVKRDGYPSLLKLIMDRKGNYVGVMQAIRSGITPRTTVGTVEELRRLGLYEALKSA